MKNLTITEVSHVTTIAGVAKFRTPDGVLHELQVGDILQPGMEILLDGASNFAFEKGLPDAIQTPEQPADQQPSMPAMGAAAGDQTTAQINALQQAILAGQDPTQAFEAAAAGVPADAGGTGPGSGNGGFVSIVRTGGSTIAEAGYDTTALASDPLLQVDNPVAPTVALINDPTVVVADTNTIEEDTIATGNVLANDSDTDDVLSVAGFAVNGTNFSAGNTVLLNGIGALVINADGSYVFTPDPNWNGVVPQITYTTNTGVSSTLDINVTAVNDTPDAVNDDPTANPDALTTKEDTPLTILPAALLANDTDVDDDTLTISSVQGATNGTVALVDGNVVFTPAENYHGSASFTYTISDGQGGSDTATVSIEVTPVNDNPVDGNEAHVLTEDSGTYVAVGNALTNASDVDGDPLTVSAGTGETKGSYGTLILGANGEYTYTLDNASAAVQSLKAGDTVQDTFIYAVSDGNGGTTNSTITIRIVGANDSAQVTVSAEGADSTVYEHGLLTVPDTSETDGGSFQVSASDGIKEVVIGGATFSLAQLQDAGYLAAHTVNTGEGTLTLTGYSSSDDKSATITYSYTLAAAQEHGLPGNDSLTDSVGVTVNGVGGSSDSANLSISIIDDIPVATGDGTQTVTEDGNGTTTLQTVTGGVLGNDSYGADGANVDAGTAFSWDANTAAKAALATYGTLTLGSDGTYTFTLDNSSAAVQGLTSSSVIEQTLTYTITDHDGDTSPASVTIRIVGANDSAQVTVSAEGADSTVYEHGLLTVPDTSETDGGSFQVSASDGIKEVVIGGATFSLAQLQDAGYLAAHTVNTGEGTLTLTGYSSSDDKSATITYSYTLAAAQEHGLPGNDSLTDSVGVTVNGVGGSSDSANLSISIIDDIPVATGDGTQTVTEDGNGTTTLQTVTGGVLGNDSYGADGANVDAGTAFSWDANTAAKAALATYGTLTLGSDGTYTFTLDNSSAAVQGLTSSSVIEQTLTYTITDHDGDTSPASVTIRIVGANDSAQVTVSAEGADSTVYEHGLLTVPDTSETDGGSFQVSASDGIKEVVIGGATFSLAQLQDAGYLAAHTVNTGEGTLTLTGYSSSDDKSATITYSYTLAAAQEHGLPGNDSLTDSVGVTVNGVGGSSDSANLSISIIDDIPVATGDGTQTVTEDGNGTTTLQTVTGGVLGNDSYGADGANVDAGTAFSWDANTAAKAALATYGTLTLGSDGTYTFTLDNSSAAVQGLTSSSVIEQTLTYTITDHDGDTSPASVTIRIVGANDSAQVTVSAEGADSTVYEHGLLTVPDTSETDGGSFQVSASDGIKEVVIGGATFSLAQLQDAGYLAAHTVNTGEGTLTLTGYSSSDDKSATITYSYTLAAAQEHGLPGNDSLTDSVGVTVNGVGGSSDSANLSISIIDDIPVATGDGTQTVTEDGNGTTTLQTVTGGVLGNDSYGADGANVDAGTAFSWDANTAAKAALATYGTLTLGSDGTYTFTLDNSSAAVQGLTSSSVIEQTLTYTITDHDGDTSPASVTIRIVGANDSAQVTVSAEGADSTVYEHGLLTVPDTSETDGGSFQVSASDGIKEVVIGGATFSLAQLQDAGYLAAHTVNTGEGTLTLTGYSSSDDKSATITYSYTLAAAQEHGLPGNDSLTDSVGVTVNGVGGSSDSANLSISIIDDIPVATGDGTQTVTEDGNGTTTLQTVTGGVLGNDSYGADGANVDAGTAFSWDANTAAKAALATYGTLTLGSDGTYTFTLDNSSAAVQGLTSSSVIEQTLTYTITDHDGDTSPASVTIRIVGANDSAQVTVSAEGADSTVYEHGLLTVPDTSETDGGSFQVSASDGIKEVVIGGATFSLAQLQDAGYLAAHTVNTGEGTLTLTGYSSSDDKSATITYSYTLAAAQEHGLPGNDSLTDSVGVTVNGVGGSSDSANLSISIIDDIPVATGDGTQTVTEDGNGTTTLQTVTGGVLGNDSYGADGANVDAGTAFSWDANTAAKAALATYGTLTLGSDGTYTFTLDNSSAAVQGLTSSSVIEQTLTYTITDHDGDTSPASVTIRIVGANDSAQVTVSAEGADSTVYEHGLLTVPDTSETDGGSFQVSASDGIKEVVIGGATFSLAQLQDAGYLAAHTVNTGEGTLTLTGYSSSDDKSATITYSYTLAAAQEHGLPGNDSLTDSVGVTVNGVGGSSDTANLHVNIIDDVPAAVAVYNSGQSVLQTDTNLMLVLDVSGSMRDASGYQGMTRLQVMQKSALELLEQYDALGNVRVNIITFSTAAANPTTNWVTIDAAKAIILGLSAGGNTNYDDALNEAWRAFSGDTGALSGAQNISYFMSDGAPNTSTLSNSTLTTYGTGTNDLGGGSGIDLSEEADWIGFLKNFDIKSYSLGMGNGVNQSNLNPIAYNGVSETNMDSIVVTDLSQLQQTLVSTVVAPPLGGDILNGGLFSATTGADGGWVYSVTVNGVTYSYDRVLGASVSGGVSAGTFNTTTHEWTISTPAGASLKIDMDDGQYVYLSPGSTTTVVSETFGYAVIDGDGDTASSSLTLTVDPATEPLVVRDDKIITNQTTNNIPEWALLVNDTGAGVHDITAIAGVAASDAAVLAAGSVTYTDHSPSGGGFTYTDTVGTSSDTAHVTIIQDTSGAIDGSYLDEILIDGNGDGTLNGNDGNDVLLGYGGNDTLNGGAGDDILAGGAGNDALNGGAGNDTAAYTDASASVTVSLAITTAQNTGGDGTDTLNSIENLIGSAYGDTLTGDGGNNVLNGYAGDDHINGAAGNDTMIGGQGNDILTGGAGIDTFTWTANDVASTTHYTDTITDFSTNAVNGDKLDLSAVLNGDTNTNLDNYLQFSKDGAGDAVISVHKDGDLTSTPDMTIVVEGHGATDADLTALQTYLLSQNGLIH